MNTSSWMMRAGDKRYATHVICETTGEVAMIDDRGELAFPHNHHLATRLLIDSSFIVFFYFVFTEMLELPSEVWTRVAFFACRDGGRMGAVLQQVSKLVAHGTAVHKNGVVMLLSAVQARLFYDYISLAEPIFQHVDSLLIDTVTTSEDSAWDELSLTRIPAILNLLPYLRSLTLFPSSEANQHLFKSSMSVTLPHLESLSIWGYLQLPSLGVPQLATLLVMFGDSNLVVSLRSQAPLLQCIQNIDSFPESFIARRVHGYSYTKFIACIRPEVGLHGTAFQHARIVSGRIQSLEQPVEHFTLVIRKWKTPPTPLDARQEEDFITRLQNLVHGRSTETYRFKVLLQMIDRQDTAELQSLQWRDMFLKAVLEGNEMADIYAEEHLVLAADERSGVASYSSVSDAQQE
jgi:hypothetical protein